MQHVAGNNINAVDDAGDSAVALAMANGHEESLSRTFETRDSVIESSNIIGLIGLTGFMGFIGFIGFTGVGFGY